jgi:hypothetical protein
VSKSFIVIVHGVACRAGQVDANYLPRRARDQDQAMADLILLAGGCYGVGVMDGGCNVCLHQSQEWDVSVTGVLLRCYIARTK